MRLILLLDPGLATPTRLRDLILQLYTPEGLLLSSEKRSILFDLLSLEQAHLLTKLLGIKYESQPHELLKQTTIRRGSEREKALFDFFGLTIPSQEIQESGSPVRSAIGQYPLFAHQRLAARKVSKQLYESPNRVMLHMPTGAGKTRTAMNVIAEHLRLHEPTLVIWLAHTEELCEQSASEFERAWSYLGNREIDVFRFWGNRTIPLETVRDGILIGGLAKMYSATKERLSFITSLASRTSLVVIDEAHSAIAETYKLILDALVKMRYPNPALLGLTATPGRTWADIQIDEQLAKFFSRRKVTLEVEGYTNPVDYLIDEQYLARVDYKPLFYEGGIELSAADIRRVQEHFDIPENILRRLAEDEMRNLAIITAIEALAKQHRRILVFAATVEHSNLLASVLQMRGYDASSVTGTTSNVMRTRTIDRFKQETQDVRIICNFGVLTTGFDAPKTSAALIARPTKSLVLYSQMVGRAIRGKQAGGNEIAEIVTVVDYDLPGFGSVAEAFNNWEDIWE
jgi:superfamily II DNA or RNA helicase